MTNWIEKECSISEIEELLEQYDVEIDSPDGFVPVNFFIDKGHWKSYELKLEDGREVLVNENHLFETIDGWKFAKDIQEDVFLTDTGFKYGKITEKEETIPIVDINVNHENHRYYANGVSSHNTGVGKSLFMCHVAAGCLSQGYNVLYITLEMAEERIAERIDANLLNVTMNDLHTMSKVEYDRKFDVLRNKTHGKLIIKEYPTASANSLHFRALLNELHLKRNFQPQIIFIDYLNICSSARIKPGANVNSYSYIKAIAEELRGLAVEFNVPIVSATQTTRSGYTNTDVGLEDTSESFGLPATADFMFALISTEELEQLNQLMVKQLKNRYGDPNLYKRFVVGVDRSKMKLYDAEASAQDDIIDSGQVKNEEETSTFSRDNKFKKKYDGFKV